MGKHLFQSLPLFLALFLLTACGQDAQAEDPKWQDCRQLYATVLTNSGEDESTARYLSIAQRSQALLPLLEEKAGAFVMNAYNYQAIDDDGSPLYTCNGFGDCPEAIAPNGHTIQVSPNYFRFNPLETADGRDLLSQLVFADDTLNLLVPEQFRPQEAQILQAHRADFYFQKVTAANDYNEMAQIPERLTLTPEDLHLNIISQGRPTMLHLPPGLRRTDRELDHRRLDSGLHRQRPLQLRPQQSLSVDLYPLSGRERRGGVWGDRVLCGGLPSAGEFDQTALGL